MGAYASDLVFAQQSATNTHQGTERTWAEGREGATGCPWEEGGTGNQRTEFLGLCLGESTKAKTTHPFVVRVLLNGFPKKSTELSSPPSWMDTVKSAALLCSLFL